MTAAAGFTYKDGILMCADTLISGGIVSGHKSKLGGFRFRDGVAIFAIAGHVDMAEAAIEQCEEPLCSYTGAPRTRTQIAAEVRKVLCAEYKTHIIDNHYEHTEFNYNILVTIQSHDGLGLYVTARSQMKRSRQGFEFIGSGESIMLLAVRRFGDPRLLRSSPAKRVSFIAAYALGEAKRHQEGVIGGGSVLIHLEKGGGVRAAYECNEELVEKYATRFHRCTDQLLQYFIDPAEEESFSKNLTAYPAAIAELRKQYREESASLFHLGPLETGDVLWEINTIEHLRRRRLRGSAQ
jgi:hypothetical protein